jgi:tRNA G18 (ribose-2'-O)-methylase SpoU
METQTKTFNAIDYYKDWQKEQILADLNTKRFNFSVLCANLTGDFNKSCIVRNANAFMAKEVILYGKKQFDRRGCVGTQNYTNFKHVKQIDDLKDLIKSTRIIAIDNIEGAVPLTSFTWPKDEHFIVAFGEEQVGLPKEVLDVASDIVYIKQYGSVRSINVASASAIIMNDIVTRNFAKE